MEAERGNMLGEERSSSRLRLPGSRSGRRLQLARPFLVPLLQFPSSLDRALPIRARDAASRLPCHARDVGVLQDLSRLLLLFEGPIAPDVGRAPVRFSG